MKIRQSEHGAVWLKISLLVLLTWLPVSATADTFLLMAEEEGCFWCEKWDDEIAPIYPKTAEGEIAPLRRYDLHSAAPKNVTFLKRVHYSPTFVLVKDGIEVGRIEGYPGEDFFWGLLSKMFEEARIEIEAAGQG